MSNRGIPSGEEVLELERLSRRHGSGLTTEQLLGRWRLQLLWGKGRAQPSPVTAALLRNLQASLSLATPGCTPDGTAPESGALTVVTVSSLERCSCGSAVAAHCGAVGHYWSFGLASWNCDSVAEPSGGRRSAASPSHDGGLSSP